MSAIEVEILTRAGAPIGAPRRAPRSLPPDDDLRRAVSWLATDERPLDPAPFVAWLSAFEHHWPTRFHALFGTQGAELLSALRGELTDENRYLKLRRIAVENLSGVL